MERLKLNAEVRNRAGQGLKPMRKGGFVPAILYGQKKEPRLIKVDRRTLEKAIATKAGFNAIFDFQIDGQDAGLVRIREYQAHPIKRVFTHVDFQSIDLNEKVEVDVRVELVGHSIGVKDEGGVLDIHRRTLHLKCLVTQIPEKIQIDISALKVYDTIHANDIQLPDGVEFPHDQNFTIVAVVPPKKEEEAVVAAPVEGAVVAAAGEEGAEKKEEEPKQKEKQKEKKE